jgi:2-methylisocitrate lyase-like PEP mutase family enzyme
MADRNTADMHRRDDLRRRLARPADQIVIAPLALDALSAALARQVGFDAVYVGGGGLGYARGVSEALLTTTEVAEVTRAISECVDVAVVVDATNGFGDAVHTARTVRLLEQAGAAAVEIEDQLAPKRAHHHKGHDHMIGLDEMVGKIEAAVQARTDPDLLVIVRTNALTHDGLQDALARVAAYEAAGADLLLVLPRAADELAAIGEATTVPLVTFAPAGIPTDDLRAAGVTLLCDPFSATLLTVRALRAGYETLRTGGTVVEPGDVRAALQEVGDIIGIQRLYDIEARTTERAFYEGR